MATITITEILGGDNIAASRVVLNNNFSLLQNAINTLETRLNTSYVPGGSLNVGDAQILKYTRSIATNIFLVQASAQIDGNISIGTPTNPGNLTLTGATTVGDAITVGGAVNFTDSVTNQYFTNDLRTISTSAFSNVQWYDQATAVDTQALLGDLTTVITNDTRVLHLNIATYTGVAPFDHNTFILPAANTLDNGQIITLAFSTTSGTTGIFSLDNTTVLGVFDPAFDNAAVAGGIVFNSSIQSTDSRFTGIWMTLIAGPTGWKVIDSHIDGTYI